MEQLEILARQFRDAIERTPVNQLPITMHNFPAGACGDAALLLGHYLKAQGLDAFDYVLGERDDQSHAWLQQGEIIIDITADQFAEIDQPVIVTADPAGIMDLQPECCMKRTSRFTMLTRSPR